MGKTDIGWTERSINPIRARNKETGKLGWWCSHESPGCVGCYAEARNLWIGNFVRYQAQLRDKVELFVDLTFLGEPFRVKKPAMWFVCSMTDLFGQFVPDPAIDTVYAMMAMNPDHTFQVLTKRHERMRTYLKSDRRQQIGEHVDRLAKHYNVAPVDLPDGPLPNVWWGVSIEDKRRARERLPVLRDTPATLRMVSFEPLLEALDEDMDLSGIHWGIIGGHSGYGASEFHCEWGIDLLGKLKRAGVAPYMKQIGSKPRYQGERIVLKQDDSKGENPAAWPEALRIRDYPRVRV